jgi:hypothetical protein
LLKTTLERLRTTFTSRAEKAYKERDAADFSSDAEFYAAGEAHAFGVASDEVREAEKTNDADAS